MEDVPVQPMFGEAEDSYVASLLSQHIPKSVEAMNPGQLLIVSPRERMSERNVVDQLATNLDLRWVFWEPHDLAEEQTEEAYLRQRFNRDAIRTCCLRTILGFPWYPGHAGGRIPLFNPDQLTRIHAMVLDGAIERNEFIEEAMKVRAQDWANWMRDALGRLRMNSVVNQHDRLMRDYSRSSRWLRSWVENQGLRLHFPEPIEAKRKLFAARPLIFRWFMDMMPFVETIPRGYRFSADECMITISRSCKFVVYPGQRVFVEEKEKFPHFTILPCFNPDGEGPRPMLVVPSLSSASQVFAGWSAECYITTSASGWVGGETWIEWARLFCQWLDAHRERRHAVGQVAVLFVDSAPTRGNVQALEIFRQHNVLVITFPPHMTHVLQPVDATWARSFKSDFVQRFRAWSKPDTLAALSMALAGPRGVSPTMLRRGQIVAAAVESARSATRRSICLMGFTVTGLADERGTFSPTRPLGSVYVQAGTTDPEMEERARNPGILYITSSVLTSDECLAALRARDAAKARHRRRGRARAQDIAPLPEDPDADNFQVEDGKLFAARAIPGELADGGEPDLD